MKRDYIDKDDKELITEMSKILKSLNNFNDKENIQIEFDSNCNNNEVCSIIDLEESGKNFDLDRIFLNYVNSQKSDPIRRKVTNIESVIRKELASFRKGERLSTNLETIFKSIKDIRSTSVSVERLFSSCSYILNKYRNRLDAITLNNIITLRFYFNMKNKAF